MPRGKSSPPPASHPEVDRLADVVVELSQRVQLLQQAIDDLREDFEWALDNDRTVVWPTVPCLKRLRRSGGNGEVATRIRPAESAAADSPIGAALRQLTEDLQIQMADIATEQLELMLVELGQSQERIIQLLKNGQSQQRLLEEDQVEVSSDDNHPGGDDVDGIDTASSDVKPFASGDIVSFILDGHPYTGEVLQIDRDIGKAEICLAPSMSAVSIDLDLLEPAGRGTIAEDWPEAERPSLTLFDVGDAVEFEIDGEEQFGEIIALDDARNTARVLLISSEEEITVEQDRLTKVVPDELSYTPTTPLAGDERSTEEIRQPESAARRIAPSIESESDTGEANGRPCTLREVRNFRDRLLSGRASLVDLRRQFDRLASSRDAFLQELINAYDLAGLKQLAHAFGIEARDRQRRPVALRIYEALLREFLCGRRVDPSVRSPMLELLISHNIDRLTEDDLPSSRGGHGDGANVGSTPPRPSPTLF